MSSSLNFSFKRKNNVGAFETFNESFRYMGKERIKILQQNISVE